MWNTNGQITNTELGLDGFEVATQMLQPYLAQSRFYCKMQGPFLSTIFVASSIYDWGRNRPTRSKASAQYDRSVSYIQLNGSAIRRPSRLTWRNQEKLVLGRNTYHGPNWANESRLLVISTVWPWKVNLSTSLAFHEHQGLNYQAALLDMRQDWAYKKCMKFGPIVGFIAYKLDQCSAGQTLCEKA